MTLNLVKKELSDIDYKIFTFPDGEIQIELLSDIKDSIVNIECRITCANDLFILMQVGDILNRLEIKFTIAIYYLMSMRMDRVMSISRPYSLKIVMGVINSLNPQEIFVYEPHSNKLVDPGVFNDEIRNILDMYEDDILVYPDEGAYDRYSNQFYRPKYIECTKIRNLETGKIEYYDIDHTALDIDGDLLVIDDLCDGGNTFRLLANSLRNKYPDKKLKIFVTHMVNPKGIETLSEYYDEVYFTNSYKDWDNLPDNVTMIDLWKN